ncbi:hypothetical protein HMPREF0971_03032 [Segatella oris F0302]|uniref:Uncharacterized protein n=1 Tax=Segatella oris F0302 TaxID=649760 RepID=D1QVA7_9BACT|nr:hypothetical protein HMPREF0971_03032 [Segatella oris F0302]
MNENGDCSTLFVYQIQTGFAFASPILSLCRERKHTSTLPFLCPVTRSNAI